MMASLWILCVASTFYAGFKWGRHYEGLCQEVMKLRRQLRDNPPSPPEGGA